MFTTQQGNMLRFATNCQDVWTRELHPLVVDAWFMSQLSTLGITPLVESISSPMAVTTELVAQFNLTMSEQEMGKCIAKGGSIRFMMTPAMSGYLSAAVYAGSVTVYESLLIGRRLVYVLTLLHRTGITHRNVRPESVWFRGTAEVQLIDFSRAGIGSHEEFGDDVFVMSPWELENPTHVRTRRDDLWRALRVIAMLMHGKRFEEYERFVLEQHGMEYLNWWKFSGDIFAIPNSNPLAEAAVRPAQGDIHSPYRYIMRGFRRVMQAVACIDSNRESGNYQEIIDSFDNHILPYVAHETRVADK
jgi:serine/threonine protein kinase